MPLVLAIEPDLRQATILKRIVREKVHADVSVVDSPDAAIGAIRIQIPDVLLLSALLSPRDEDELIAHLRTLDGADHIQTHTIPQLAATAADQEGSGRGRGLFGAFRRKKENAQQTSGCDPDLFAEEISAYLQRAAEKKAESAAAQQSRQHQLDYLKESSAAVAAAAERYSEPAPVESEPVSGAWASPFEWKPATQESRPAAQAATEPAPFEPTPVPDLISPPEAVEAGATDVEALGVYEDPAPPQIYEEPAPIPVYEEPVITQAIEEIPPAALETHVDPEPLVVAAPPAADAEDHFDYADEPVAVAAAPAPPTASAARLAPLAMWARTEAAAPPVAKSAPPEEPRTISDELRNLMSALAVPPNVAGVSYAHGCRIRRVRVPGGKDRRRGETPGPVILSKRALEEARTPNA